MRTHAKRELQWGVRETRYPPPQVKRLCGFCALAEETFASSDGRHITIWTPRQVVRMIDVPAVAMVYVSSISHIIAVCKDTPELVFVQIAPPYQIVRHHQLFATKIITAMHYFERAGTLVCAGQGLMFGHLKIPPIFKSSTAPNPEMLSVSKICEAYEDVLFTGLHMPVFNDTDEIVLVYHQYDVFIHRADGSCVQRILKFTDNPISCVSFNDVTRQVVAGDVAGRVSVLKLEVRQPFIEGAQQDPCAGIEKMQSASAKLVYAGVHGCGFLLSISIDKQATLTYMKSSTIVQSFRLPFDVVFIYPMENKMLFFARNDIYGYHVDIFTDFFADIVTQVTSLRRCPSSCHAARILMVDNHAAVTMFSPKTGAQLFSIRACHYKDDIHKVLYPREIIRDGENWKMTEVGDVCWLLMNNSTIMTVDLEKFRSKEEVENDDTEPILQSTTIMDAKYFMTETIRTPLTMKYASFLRIETEKYQGCVMGVCHSGHCNIFSNVSKELVEEFWIGYSDVICASFCFAHAILVVATLQQTVCFDIDNQRVVQTIPGPTIYTCLYVVSDDLIVCGAANGEVEIRKLPMLELISTSMSCSAYHCERGKRRVLTQEELSDIKSIRKIPFSVKFIDYCAPRRAILTMSPIGEVFIWSLSAFPKAHFMMDMVPTAACFADGHGSVFVTALNTIFKIHWSKFFGKPLDPKVTPLDDFDLQEDSYSLQTFNTEIKCSLSIVQKASSARWSPKSKFKKMMFISDSESESEPESEEVVVSLKETAPPQTHNERFDDLLVEQEVIPKHPFLSVKAPDVDPNMQIILPPGPPLIVIPPFEPPMEAKVKVTKHKAATPRKKAKKKAKSPKTPTPPSRPKSARKPKVKPLVPAKVKAVKPLKKPRIQKANVGKKRRPRSARQDKSEKVSPEEVQQMVEAHYEDLGQQSVSAENSSEHEPEKYLPTEPEQVPEPEITHEFENRLDTESEEQPDVSGPENQTQPESAEPVKQENAEPVQQTEPDQEPVDETKEQLEEDTENVQETEAAPDTEPKQQEEEEVQEPEVLPEEPVEASVESTVEEPEPKQEEITSCVEQDVQPPTATETNTEPVQSEAQQEENEPTPAPQEAPTEIPPEPQEEEQAKDDLIELLIKHRQEHPPSDSRAPAEDTPPQVIEPPPPPPSLATEPSDESTADLHQVRPPETSRQRSIRGKIAKGRSFTSTTSTFRPRSGPLLSITSYGPQDDTVGYYHEYLDERSKRLKSYSDARNPAANLLVQRRITWRSVSGSSKLPQT